MRDALQAGSDWLEAKRDAMLAHDVVYARGATQVTVRATIGKSEFESTDAVGVVTVIETRDFLVLSQLLGLVPRAGDRITETLGGQEVMYEVVSPAGAPAFRYSDQSRKTVRIHTVLVGEA